MSFIDKLFKRNKKIRPQDLKDFTPSGIQQRETDGIAFACMDRIASQFAKLGIGVYSQKTKEKIKNHPLYSLIEKPNLEEDRFLFFYNCVLDYFNKGCFLRVFKNRENKPISIFRLNPNQVHITRDFKTNKRIYHYNGYQYSDNEILYISSRWNYNTKTGGQSIFNASAGTFQTLNNLENYTNNSFNNGIFGKRLIIDIEKALPDATDEQIAELKALMTAEYCGVANAGKPLFKKKGIEYSEIGSGTVDNRSAELAENRKIQKDEIAMIFGVPLGLINQSSKDVDIEKDFLLLNEFAVQPIALQFEQAFNKLLDNDLYYFEFDYNTVLKVSFNQRIDAYTKQINNGLLSPNECRKKENLPEIEAGNNHFMPANLMPLTDDVIEAYMAKQKQIVEADGGTLNSDHSPNGDDKI